MPCLPALTVATRALHWQANSLPPSRGAPQGVRGARRKLLQAIVLRCSLDFSLDGSLGLHVYHRSRFLSLRRVSAG